MNKWIVLAIIILSIFLFTTICHYFISRYKRQSIQVFTIGSFLNDQHMNGNEVDEKKKSMIDRINDFFDVERIHKSTDGSGDGHDDNGGGGDDGGE